MRLKDRGASLTPERSTLDVELAFHFHELIGASVARARPRTTRLDEVESSEPGLWSNEACVSRHDSKPKDRAVWSAGMSRWCCDFGACLAVAVRCCL